MALPIRFGMILSFFFYLLFLSALVSLPLHRWCHRSVLQYIHPSFMIGLSYLCSSFAFAQMVPPFGFTVYSSFFCFYISLSTLVLFAALQMAAPFSFLYFYSISIKMLVSLQCNRWHHHSVFFCFVSFLYLFLFLLLILFI